MALTSTDTPAAKSPNAEYTDEPVAISAERERPEPRSSPAMKSAGGKAAIITPAAAAPIFTAEPDGSFKKP